MKLERGGSGSPELPLGRPARPQSGAPTTWVRRLVRVAVLGLVALFLVQWGRAPDQPDWVDFLDGLPRNGVVAADAHRPQAGGHWLVTSGALLTRAGALWSGPPDAGPTRPAAGTTGSAVLRAVSRRPITNPIVDVEMRLRAMSQTRRTPMRPWDGVHVFVGYQDANDLYSVDLIRRDGTVTIKRKSCAGAPSGQCPKGRYRTLASTRLPPRLTWPPRGGPGPQEWHRYRIRLQNLGGVIFISVRADGQPPLLALDLRPGRLLAPGRVGLRGDNADFLVRRFVAHPWRPHG